MRVSRKIVSYMLVLAVAVCMAVGARQVYLWKVPPTKKMCATFTSGFGLYPGNNVSLLGVNIGRIESVEPENDLVKVVVEIPKEVDLPADVKAIATGNTALTDYRFEFTKGYSQGPKFEENRCLEARRGETKTPISPSDSLETLHNFIEELIGEGDPHQSSSDIANLLKRVQETISGKGSEVNDIVRKSLRLINTEAFPEPMLVDLIQSTDLLLREISITSSLNVDTIQKNFVGFGEWVEKFSHALASLVFTAIELFSSIAYSSARLEPMLGKLLQLILPGLNQLFSALSNGLTAFDQLPNVVNNWETIFHSSDQSSPTPSLDVAITAAKSTCEWFNTFSPRVAPICPVDLGVGTGVDWGLVRLVLGEGGWH